MRTTVDNTVIGAIALSDTLREDAAKIIVELIKLILKPFYLRETIHRRRNILQKKWG